MSGVTATPSPWYPGNSSEQQYNYSSIANDTARTVERNVNATGNATTMNMSLTPPPQHLLDQSIVSIVIVLAAVLSLSTCCLLICRVSMWSAQRRRNLMIAEQHEGNRLVAALSMLEGLETGSYRDIIARKPTRCVTEADLNGSVDHGRPCEQQQQQIGVPDNNAAEGVVQHQEQKHKEQLKERKGEEGEEETCTVCLCEFADDASVRLLPCGHFFHTECVDCWLQKNPTCPTCRWTLFTEDQECAAAAAAAGASSRGADAGAWAHERHSPQQMQSISIEAVARPPPRPRAQEAPSHSRSLVQVLGDILTAILISEHGTLA